MPRFDVVRMVGPVAPPAELRIVSVAPILSALTAIVYVILGVTLASRVRAQLDAVVSSVPVKPVMSMLAIVVAAARVVVPVGVALKITSFVATGVQLHVAPPDVFDQFAPVAQVPPGPIR